MCQTMFRKDAYNRCKFSCAALFALILSVVFSVVVSPTWANPTPTNSPMHIDTAVSVTYVPTAGNAVQTVTSNTASIVVPQTAGVFLSPVLGSQQLPHVTQSVYPVTVHNTGNGTDTYALYIVRTMGWGATLLNADHTPAPATVTLATGASQTFLLALTPPSAAAHACAGMAVLKAISSVSPTVYGQAAALTRCLGR